MVKFFQRNIFACLSHILILQWLRFFSIFQLKLNVYSPKFEINNPIFFYVFECWLHYLALVKIFQHIIFASLSYIRILQWLRFFFSIFQFKINVYFPKFEINNPIFYYIFKCGLHYLAMVKLFQRKFFACLSYIRTLQWLRFFFSIFQFKFNVYFPKFEINNQLLRCCQNFPRFCGFGLHI